MVANKAVLALVLFLIVSSFTLIALAYNKQKDQLEYLCSTSSSLAQVLNDAAKSIEDNFSNGTYARLLQQGVITPENIKNSQKTLDSYKAQVKILTDPNSPCHYKSVLPDA